MSPPRPPHGTTSTTPELVNYPEQKSAATNMEIQILGPYARFWHTFSRRRLDCVRDSPQPVADEPRVLQRVQPQHMSHHRPPSPCEAIFTPEHPALWPKLSVTRRLSGRSGRNSTALSARRVGRPLRRGWRVGGRVRSLDSPAHAAGPCRPCRWPKQQQQIRG